MGKRKGFSIVNWIFIILGLICTFLCPAFIQPWSTLTSTGVTVLFVFIGTLLMVIGSNSLIWPIFVAMAGLVAYGCTSGNEIAASLFSNGTVIMMLGVFSLSWALNESGFGYVVAHFLLTRKVLRGRPVLFTMVLFLALLVMAIFTSVFGALMFGLLLVKTLCEQAGYDTESDYYKLCQMGAYMFATMGCMFFPFTNGMVFAALNSISTAFGTSVSTVSYTLSGLIVDIVFIILYVLMIKFVFRVDMGKMADIDAAKLSENEAPKLTKKQIVLVISFMIAALYSFIVAILPAGNTFTLFFSSFGGSLWFCMVVAVLCIVHMEGKPVIDIRTALKEGVDWNTLFAIGGFMMLSNYVSNENSGIMEWLRAVFKPVLGGISNIFVLMLVVCLITIIISNFFSNMMTVIIFGSVVGPFISNFTNINPVVIMTALVFCAWNAYLTVAANGTAPILLGYEGIDTKFIWSKGVIVTIVYAIVAAVLFTGLAFVL